jgi:hypothetical protein
MSLAAGSTLEPHEILAPIGTGGMGKSTAFTSVGKSTAPTSPRYSP